MLYLILWDFLIGCEIHLIPTYVAVSYSCITLTSEFFHCGIANFTKI